MALANTEISVEILAEISWFNEQLADLKNTFVAWIKEEGHEISVSEESITNNIKETKIKRYNMWSKYDPYEPEFLMVDGYTLTYSIPFDGDEDLLKIRTSRWIMARFDVKSLISPCNDELGSIILEFECTKQE